MERNNKSIIYTLCIVATILIVIGAFLTLKDFLAEEDMLNVADTPGYYRITFNLNGASMIEYKSLRCKEKNGSCTLVLPNATRRGGTVLGYSDNKDDLEAKYKIGEKITLTDNIDLYAISYSTYNLTIDQNGVDYLEKDSVSCNAYNENLTCQVTIPNYNKAGYETKGYSTVKESSTGFIYANSQYSLSSDLILYPIYSTSSRHRSLNIVKTFNYLDSIIEVENGCSESVYKEYLKHLDGISEYVPFLLLGNKITFVVDSSFDAIWGPSYVGMNYGPRSLRSVDIRCSTTKYNDYYATMVHEMAHSWDFYYASKLGENISSQPDIINLYNKYKNKSNRPFREYSYSNLYEFVADMMRYYYFKYYVPKSPFKGYNYPSDIKKALEKYICISKNNYDESKCK